MPEDYVDTYFYGGRWWNRVVYGATDELIGYASHADAVAAGRELAEARESEHIERDRNCEIVHRHSYRHVDVLDSRRWWTRLLLAS